MLVALQFCHAITRLRITDVGGGRWSTDHYSSVAGDAAVTPTIAMTRSSQTAAQIAQSNKSNMMHPRFEVLQPNAGNQCRKSVIYLKTT
jgi:hypothetical protein